MKIETTPRDDQQIRIVAEFESADLEKYRRKAARKISGQAKIPGFRPGKAPYDIVVRTYGEETITHEALDLLLDEQYPAILDQAAVEPSGPGKIEEIISEDPPIFAFIVPLRPEVDLGDYRSVRLPYELAPVTDEEVDTFLSRLRKNMSTAEAVDRPAADGDLVFVRIDATRLDPAEDETPTLLQGSPLQVALGAASTEEDSFPFKGFSSYVLGMSATEEKTFQFTYPDDSEFERLRGKPVEFHFVVESVKTLHLPELNDEFAQSIGEFETMDALRAAVQHQLEHNHQDEYDKDYFDQLMDLIVEGSVVKYPPHMLDEEVEHVLESLQRDLAQQHLDLDAYLKSINKDRETFLAEDVRPAAEKRLARSLVFDEVARREEVKVGGEELKSAFDQMMFEMSQTSDLKKMRGKMTSEQFVNTVATEAAYRLLNQHVMDRLKAIATGKADEVVEAAVEETAAETTTDAVDAEKSE